MNNSSNLQDFSPNNHVSQSVMIVDSRELIGLGLKQAFSKPETCLSVDYVPELSIALPRLESYLPALLILSTSSEGRCVYSAAEEIKQIYPEIKIAFLSSTFNSLQLERGLRARGQGFFLERDKLQEIKEGITHILAGNCYFSSSLSMYVNHLDRTKVNQAITRTEILALTSRQMELLVYLAKGSSVKEAAKLMHISDKSVDSHKYRIMNRLNIHDRVELALFAIKEGLIQL